MVKAVIFSLVLILSSMALLLTSCASLKGALERCVYEEEADVLLPTLEKAADSNAQVRGVPVTKTVEVEHSCHRRVYSRSGHRLLIFTTPGDADTTVKGTLSDMRKTVRTHECFDRALKDLNGLNRPELSRVLAEHQKRWDYLWKDLDVGPVKWLQCDQTKGSKWSEGLNSLIHELNHENHSGKCIFFPKDGSKLCFDLPDDLPRRSLGKVEAFPASPPAHVKFFREIQDIYMVTNDEPVEWLFEELHSYTLSLMVMTELMSKRGVTALFDGQERSPVVLPLFLLNTKLYLNRLKQKEPKDFQMYLAPGTPAATNLYVILRQAEDVYAAWLAALKKAGKPEYQIEKALWDEYKK